MFNATLRIFFSLIIVISCSSLQSSGQSNHYIFQSHTLSEYSKTDFSNVDSLSCWFYVLWMKESSQKDSVKSLGELTFQRDHEVKDSISQSLYKSGFLPLITFQVYDINDSAYCYKKSLQIKMISSCMAPDAGGDIIIFGKYIFLNLQVCLHCKRFDNGVDYCRPMVNKIFSDVDKSKANSLEEIIGQFPIKGKIIRSPF
jgi:hypothetical protein